MDVIPSVSQNSTTDAELGGGIDVTEKREEAPELRELRVGDKTEVVAALTLLTRAANAGGATAPAHRGYGRSDGAGQGNGGDD